MNPVRELYLFVRLNWRIIALCALVAVIVAGLTRYDHNNGRFVPVPDSTFGMDTRTGQYCNPWPQGKGPTGWNYLPRCSDIAKSWR
jgi:hypothetical protein